MNLPMISIITVVLNSKLELEKTINSIKDQTYKNFEYIIIDGGSSDGTGEVISQNEEYITKILIERDDGIYDAMNKGLKLAEGNWLLFLNAGDTLSRPTILNDIKPYLNKEYGVIYTDTICDYGSFTKTRKAISDRLIPEKIMSSMPICHNSTIIDAKIHKNRLYNTTYSIGADYDFFLSLFHNKVKFFKASPELTKIEVGKGISYLEQEESFKQHVAIQLKRNPKEVNIEKTLAQLYKIKIKTKIKSALPKKLILQAIKILP